MMGSREIRPLLANSPTITMLMINVPMMIESGSRMMRHVITRLLMMMVHRVMVVVMSLRRIHCRRRVLIHTAMRHVHGVMSMRLLVMVVRLLVILLWHLLRFNLVNCNRFFVVDIIVSVAVVAVSRFGASGSFLCRFGVDDQMVAFLQVAHELAVLVILYDGVGAARLISVAVGVMAFAGDIWRVEIGVQ